MSTKRFNIHSIFKNRETDKEYIQESLSNEKHAKTILTKRATVANPNEALHLNQEKNVKNNIASNIRQDSSLDHEERFSLKKESDEEPDKNSLSKRESDQDHEEVSYLNQEYIIENNIAVEAKRNPGNDHEEKFISKRDSDQEELPYLNKKNNNPNNAKQDKGLENNEKFVKKESNEDSDKATNFNEENKADSFNIVEQSAGMELEDILIVKRDSEDEIYNQKMEEIEEKKGLCKQLEYGSNVAGYVGDLLGDIPDPTKVSAGFAMLAHTAQFGFDITSTTLECDDVNFDEIKLIMDKRFNEIDRKLGGQMAIMQDISRKVGEILVKIDMLQTQMNRGFRMVLDEIKDREVYAIINEINTFVNSFEIKRDSMKHKRKIEYFAELSREKGILGDLEKYTEPRDSLYSALHKLIDPNNHYSHPKDADDMTGFQGLYALIFGTHTYALIMFYVVQQYFYLANFYYEEGRFEEFNKKYQTMQSVFSKFQSSLIGGDTPLIDEVIGIMNDAKDRNYNNKWYAYASSINLQELKRNVTDIELNIISDVEDVVEVRDIDFAKPDITSHYGIWEDRSSVKYAVQLRDNGIYSIFGSWSREEIIAEKANPTLTIPEDDNQRERLVFRKFDRGSPEFIGIMENNKKQFRDINRDLYNAAGRGDQEAAYNITKMLIENNADISAKFDRGRSSLHAAAIAGNDLVAKDFLIGKMDTSIKDNNGYTAMHLAAESDQKDFIKFLIDNNVDVNVHTTSEELTPLHIAAKNGYLDVVQEIMISPNLKIDETDVNGFTALHHATHKKGNSRIVTELIKNNDINVSAKTKLGLTAFHLAAINGFTDVVEAFYNNGKFKDINEATDEGMTALHYAAMFGKNPVVHQLLKKDIIAINEKATANKWTPLHLAIYFKWENPAIELLNHKKIDIHATDGGNNTPLHLSIASGESMYNVFKILLDKQANIKATTSEGFTPLHIAAMSEYPEFTMKLLDLNSSVNELSGDGSTPLHLAAKFRRLKSVSKLLKNNASTIIPNNDNILAVQYSVMQLDFDGIREFKKYNNRILHDSTTDDILDEVVFRRIYHYTKYKDSTEYARYSKLSPYEVFQELKLFNLYDELFSNRDVANYSLHYVLREEVEPCIAKEINNDPDIKCQYEGFIPSDSADLDKFMMTLPYRSSGAIRLGRSIENSNSFTSRNLDLIGNGYDDLKSARYGHQTVDSNGLLLLLNVLVRKFTGAKFDSYSSNKMQHLEDQALALDIVEKFGNLIKALKNTEVEDLIDVSEVHAKVFKAIQNGNELKIPKILCSYGVGLIDQDKIYNMLSSAGELYLPRRRIETSASMFLDSCMSEASSKAEATFGNHIW